ncbi:hypothetical protein CJF31_00005412 [Rutstroemia sp. NJR-2017a BVV2]|nr:hypothetical protein CJF31_00005412 [Rutstroemia sp. NJR-2017a BVV2]
MPRPSILPIHRILLTTRPRPNLLAPQRRTLTRTRALLLPRKGAQDKDSIDRSPTEYTRSGTDDGAVSEQKAAFDPSMTSPEAEREEAGKGPRKSEEPEGENPLDVSPANPEVSKPKGTGNSGAERSKGEESGAYTGTGGGRGSGFGSPNKGAKRS